MKAVENIGGGVGRAYQLNRRQPTSYGIRYINLSGGFVCKLNLTIFDTLALVYTIMMGTSCVSGLMRRVGCSSLSTLSASTSSTGGITACRGAYCNGAQTKFAVHL